MVAAREDSKWALHKLRKFTGWYTHGVPHGRELRQRINDLADVPAFLGGGRELLRGARAEGRLNRHEVELDCAPEAAAAAVERAAEAWGAEWAPAQGGGRLVLPVVFGLRHGVAVGRLDIARLGSRSRLTWELEESHLEVHRAAVAVLALRGGAAAGRLSPGPSTRRCSRCCPSPRCSASSPGGWSSRA